MANKQYVAYNLSGDIVPIETDGGGGAGIDEEARAMATAAQTTAETAQTTATAAQSAADTAQTTAETAQSTANKALEEVSDRIPFQEIFDNVNYSLDITEGNVDLQINTSPPQETSLISNFRFKISSYMDSQYEPIYEVILVVNNFMEFNLTNGIIYFYKGTPQQKTINLLNLAS